MSYEYRTTNGPGHPVRPEGELWEMCGSAALLVPTGCDTYRERFYWFWRRPLLSEAEARGHAVLTGKRIDVVHSDAPDCNCIACALERGRDDS